MAKVKTPSAMARARCGAAVSAGFLGGFVNCGFFTIIVFFLVAVWLIYYFQTGCQQGLPLDVPIANFTNGTLGFTFDSLDEFLFDSATVTLEGIRQSVPVLLIWILCIGLHTIPQWNGCNMLEKAIDLRKDPLEACRLVGRHQIVQRLVCLFEVLLMIVYCVRLWLWPELGTSRSGFFILFLAILIYLRILFLRAVGQFGTQLLAKIKRQAAPKTGKPEEKKEEEPMGQKDIYFCIKE